MCAVGCVGVEVEKFSMPLVGCIRVLFGFTAVFPYASCWGCIADSVGSAGFHSDKIEGVDCRPDKYYQYE